MLKVNVNGNSHLYEDRSKWFLAFSIETFILQFFFFYHFEKNRLCVCIMLGVFNVEVKPLSTWLGDSSLVVKFR